MCFTIHDNHKEITKSNEDITCYKVMVEYVTQPIIYKSIYQSFEYEQGYIYHTKIGNPQYSNKLYSVAYLYDQETHKRKIDSINEGFHSYSTFEEAYNNLDICPFNFENGPMIKSKSIVQCIIPKGSKFYYNPDEKQYVSERIKIEQTVKPTKEQEEEFKDKINKKMTEAMKNLSINISINPFWNTDSMNDFQSKGRILKI